MQTLAAPCDMLLYEILAAFVLLSSLLGTSGTGKSGLAAPIKVSSTLSAFLLHLCLDKGTHRTETLPWVAAALQPTGHKVPWLETGEFSY